LLCALLVLTILALASTVEIPSFVLALDVMILMSIAQQTHSPEESTGGFLLRSLRFVIPVAIVVISAFALFPFLSLRTNAALTGFSSGLNPSEFAALQRSRKIAFVATFPEGTPLPKAGDLFWRAEILEVNQGLRWSRAPGRDNLLIPNTRPATWNYTLGIRPGRPVAPLDLPVTRPDGTLLFSVPPEDSFSDETLWNVSSTASPAMDSPDPKVSRGNLAVPSEVASNKQLQTLVESLFSNQSRVSNHLTSLGAWLKKSGFLYTTRPGRIRGISDLLLESKKGFCEHYAAAAANLLRMAGIPTRVVSGYRGGQWNPWSRTITVRDYHAHAWLEAWDAESRQWIRFDPTSQVSAGFETGLQREVDPSRWPWHQWVAAYTANVFTTASKWLNSFWDFLVPHLGVPMVLLVITVLLWLTGKKLSSRDPVHAAVSALENYATQKSHPRKPGESVLAWVKRLRTSFPKDAQPLDAFSAHYENFVFGRPDSSKQARGELVNASKLLHKTR
jgi:transglutaminase-like putative cysteine protease